MKVALFVLLIGSILALVMLKRMMYEGFGTSPGTMVLLATSHVPTEDDAYYYRYVYPKLVRKEIYNLTESDL
jgi:hypothetical protein